MEKVICDVCKTEFTDCFSSETNQAYGCASDFHQDEKGTSVLCHYGSSYDTSRFEIQLESNIYGESGVICDSCITKMIKNQEIVEDKNFQHFG